MTINKFEGRSPRIAIDDGRTGDKEDGFLQLSRTALKTGGIPKDKVIRHAILNNLRQSQSSLSKEDWDLFAWLEDELGANDDDDDDDDDDDGLFHLTGTDLQMDEIPKGQATGEATLSGFQQVRSSLSTEDRGLVTPPQDEIRTSDDDGGLVHLTGTDLQMDEIPKDKPSGEAILNNLQQVQSSPPPEDRGLVTPPQDDLQANDGLSHPTGIDLQTGEILKGKLDAVLNVLKSIEEVFLNQLRPAQSILPKKYRDWVTPPQDDLQANGDDDGVLHLTGTDLQMGEILKGQIEAILNVLKYIEGVFLNQLRPAQSSLPKKYRDWVTLPQDDLRANGDDDGVLHLTGTDLQMGEILKGQIEAILNSFKPIAEAIVNQLQPAQSLVSTEDRDLVTQPKDKLRANDDDDGLLHLTGTDLQTGEILKHKTIGEAVLNNLQQVQSILPPEDWDLVTEFGDKLRANDEIAEVIGNFPLLYRLPSGKLSLSKTGFRLEMNLHIDLFAFLTFMDGEWLASTAIDGVLAELARISPGVQLMSSHKAFEHICKLRQNLAVDSSDIIRLHPDTHTLVFPFNLSESHWAVAKATCHEDGCFFTVYNSSPDIDVKLIRTELPAIMKCILDANSANSHWSSWWDTARRVQGGSLRQQDGHNCGIYAIFNTLALVQLQEPFLHFGSFDPRALRMEYVRALARAI